MIECLSAEGWSVSQGTDGSFQTGEIPDGQIDVYMRDDKLCKEKYGYDQLPPALSDEQIRDVYPHMLWEWKCLDDQGYEPEQPLSEQAYIDDYHQHASLWTPYSQFTSTLGEDELAKLFEDCPRAF